MTNEQKQAMEEMNCWSIDNHLRTCKNHNKNTFMNYLRAIHAKEYTGTDDDMPDDFEKWKINLDPQKYWDYQEEWETKTGQNW